MLGRNIWRSDPRWRLGRQVQLHLLQQDGLVRFGLGVGGEHDGSSISRGQVHIDHLDGCHLLQHCARRQSRRQSLQPLLQRDLQAIREEGDKDVRFDARLGLV